MRIVIEIDGDEVRMTTDRSDLSERSLAEPPEEVLLAAAALGAQSAGAAPRESDLVSVQPSELSDAARAALDAGGAPFQPASIDDEIAPPAAKPAARSSRKRRTHAS
jgi:hypothetical protein